MEMSVSVTVCVASLAGAVTVTLSVVVFVSGEAVTVSTTVVATSVVVVPPSIGTTEYVSRGRRPWNLPTWCSSARGRHIEGLLKIERRTRSEVGKLYKRIFDLINPSFFFFSFSTKERTG